MPDMRELLKQRAEKAEDAVESYEAKHAKSMAKLNATLKPRIDSLRLIGPAKPQMSEAHQGMVKERGAVGYCQFCEPPPQVFKCPKCDYEVTDRWRMTVHFRLDSKLCNDRADKKARKWAQQA